MTDPSSSNNPSKASSSSSVATTLNLNDPATPKKLPKGVVLGPDGKPCRSCTSFASWAATAKSAPSGKGPQSSLTTSEPPPNCPADVVTLGRSTWTFLHTLAATYPTIATPKESAQMSQFLSLFSQLYPCWVCAEDFRSWMQTKGNEPRLAGRDEFGEWMCCAHNEVNRKLGKKEFDCSKWEERWRTGPADGRCG